MGAERILGGIPDAVIVLDGRKMIGGWFGAAGRMFGWDLDQVRGRAIDDLLHPRDENGNPCSIGPSDPARVMRITTRMPEYEVLTTRKDGSNLWVGITCAFERGENGAIERMIVVARDASRRKRIDLEKSEVISAVSHELRSPLTSVKGFTSTLLNKWDRFDDETKLQLLRTINADADRVTRLLGELLDVSRIEAGRLQLRRQLVQVQEIANRVVERIQPQADSHTIRIEFPEQTPQVFADPDKVEQVLTNLVENAVKYTEEGMVVVSGDVEDGALRVSVADQGEGIPPDHRDQIFRKFFRRGDRSENPTGTGLGLYISKGLVEAHGGKIWAENNPGGGALFAFTLPISGPEGFEA